MFYVTRLDHPNEAVSAENVISYLRRSGREVCEVVMDSNAAARTQLAQCFEGAATAVFGNIWHLDHACIGNQSFLEIAARHHVPVIHWMSDHASALWPRFHRATPDNSRFLFLSPYSESYFRKYVYSDCRSAWTLGTGMSKRSRQEDLGLQSYLQRDIICLLPLNLKRVGGTLEDAAKRLAALPPDIRQKISKALSPALLDLEHPIESHLEPRFLAHLLERGLLHEAIQILEETVQVYRRLYVFATARDFPVLVQSDIASRYIQDWGSATLEENVGKPETLDRMRRARAVVSLTHINDEVHNRTLNGLNAGAVNIIEDTPGHRRYFSNGKNALFFRYGDDSLRECLAFVCRHPAKAYDIAQAGAMLRDDPQLQAGGFENIVELADA